MHIKNKIKNLIKFPNSSWIVSMQDCSEAERIRIDLTSIVKTIHTDETVE